jgi:alanine racemase
LTKEVPIGEGVSYGLRWRSPGSVLVATLPLGYADGISRELSGRMDVLYRGQRLPQIGTICMDMLMFAADQQRRAGHPVLQPQIGDEVLLVGREGAGEISLDELASTLGTINYDLACRLGMRLERVYQD